MMSVCDACYFICLLKVEGCVMRITFYFTILKASDPVVSLKPLQRGSCSCFSVFYVVRASGRLFAVRSKYVEPLPGTPTGKSTVV